MSIPSQLFGVSDCGRRLMVNLDDAPGTRWNHIVEAYKHKLPEVMRMIDGLMGCRVVADGVGGIFTAVTQSGNMYYHEEIAGIAKTTGLSVGKVAVMQIAYEVFAACTSIIVDVEAKTLGEGLEGRIPFHIRTMDWEFEELQELTIEVDFVRNGRTVFSATTWPGYVGVLTGVRQGVGSVSVNYRRSLKGATQGAAAILDNMLAGMRQAWPVSFLVREALSRCTSFDEFQGALQQSDLMAPTYLTIAGPEEGQGAVITRNRKYTVGDPINTDDHASVGDDEINPPMQFLREHGGLVQANMDHWRDPCDPNDSWQDICDSVARRAVVREALEETGAAITPEDLWLLVSTPPCKASDTVYTTAMCAATGAICTRRDVTEAQARAGKQRWGAVVRQVMGRYATDSGHRRQLA